MAIMSMFVFIMKPFFQSNQKDYLYIESCVNKIYGDMNNFMYASATSKWLSLSGNKIFPDQYIINIQDSNQVSLEYKEKNGNTGSYIINSLTGLKEYYCRSNSYTSKFSGDLFKLTIDKSASATNGTTQWYLLTGNQTPFIWAVSMYICYNITNCKEVGKIEIDTRIQMLKKKKCLKRNDTLWTCTNRDQ